MEFQRKFASQDLVNRCIWLAKGADLSLSPSKSEKNRSQRHNFKKMCRGDVVSYNLNKLFRVGNNPIGHDRSI